MYQSGNKEQKEKIKKKVEKIEKEIEKAESAISATKLDGYIPDEKNGINPEQGRRKTR
jgi:hypothetical protein